MPKERGILRLRVRVPRGVLSFALPVFSAFGEVRDRQVGRRVDFGQGY